MSDLTFNKVAGAVLATGLAIVGLREITTGMFASEKAEKPGYAIEVAEEAGAGGPVAEAPIDWGTVLPVADIAAGEAVFAKCKSCHTIDQGGANGTGPNQWAVIGRKPGSHAGFAYSAAMVDYSAKHPIWDYENLSEFLKNPTKAIPGTKMGFVGLKKPEDRINLLAYMNSKGGTVAFPAPNPAAAAAPAAADAGVAASATDPTATGSTATPPATSGGPAGQAPTTGAAKAPTATAAQNTGSPS